MPCAAGGRERRREYDTAMNHPGAEAQIELSGGEPGGRLTIAQDHVLRRLAAWPWREVRALLESSFAPAGPADLIPWLEVEADEDWVVLRHPRVPVISYPHEWCAEMLQQAALAHCRLLAALAGQGMALKDAHPWNVLFDGTRAIFIDIGSIVPLPTLAELDYLTRAQGRSGTALAGEVFRLMFLPYFVLPLAFHQAGLGHVARDMLWRYPLNGAGRHPRVTDYLRATRPGQWGRALRGLRRARRAAADFRRLCAELERSGALDAFASGLAALVGDLSPPRAESAYSGYYAAKGEEHAHDRPETWNAKQRAVANALDNREIRTVLDIACNTGWYSRLAAQLGKQVTAIDIDDACIAELYRRAGAAGEAIVPLVLDLAQPTPDRQRAQDGGLLLIGSERRLQADLVLALGILHHLVLGAGISLAEALARLAAPARLSLVIEFVGADDELVMKEPQFFKAFSRNPAGFAGFTLTAARDALAAMGWQVSVVSSFPATRSLLACNRKPTQPNSSLT